MAKPASPVRRTVTRVVRAARRGAPRAAGIAGKLKPVLDGALGGLAANFGRGIHPVFGPIAGLAGVGYVMNNPTLMTLAGLQASALVPFIGGGAGNTFAGGY